MNGNAQVIADRFRDAAQSGDIREMSRSLTEMSTDDFVEEYPQSRERIGREASKQINEMYGEATGTSPRMTFRRSLAGEDFFVVEGTIDYGDGIPVSFVGIGELRDGKLARMTEYFANPFEPPAWRAGMVGTMDAAPV
jgi:hypothetical protein